MSINNQNETSCTVTPYYSLGLKELEAGGKPSTWLPPGRLVEHKTIKCIVITKSKFKIICFIFQKKMAKKHVKNIELWTSLFDTLKCIAKDLSKCNMIYLT